MIKITMPSKKQTATILGIIILIFSIAYLAVKDYQSKQKLDNLRDSLSALDSQVKKLSEAEGKNGETLRRLVLAGESKQSELTDTVTKAIPSVVSIVISKEVPLLEVSYINPFGNDPFFKNFGVQVPVYQQKGVEKKEVGAGSGFIISSRGYILTNKHVVFDDSAEYTVLLSSGKQKPATIVYKDPDNDMAIIKIDAAVTPFCR